jgi:hypothetical protein
VTLGIADSGVGTTQIANSAVTDAKVATITSAGKVANSATTATSANTPDTIVARDANGDFSAGTVTLSANLALPATSGSAGAGVITLSGARFAHGYGSGNTFLGPNAGNFMNSGSGNTATGATALLNGTTGGVNTVSGYQAMYNNTGGSANTATGAFALFTNTAGGTNTAIGRAALYFSTGDRNIGIGSQGGYSLTTGSDNIDIGNLGVAAEGNTIRIGASAQTRAFIAGIRGVTTGAANAVAVLIDSNGQLGTGNSSRRYKFDIASMGDATDGLMRLRPVTFRYLAHGNNAPLQYGLIAEEVAEVYPELVAGDKEGQPETVMYQFLAPMLLNELQKEHRRNDEQQKTIDRLEQRLQALERVVGGQ